MNRRAFIKKVFGVAIVAAIVPNTILRAQDVAGNTVKPTVFAKRIAEHFNFKQYFDLIVGSELNGTRSKKSEIIDYALNMVDPERNAYTVMIGDREHDIIGVQETGIDSIGVTWGYGTRMELETAKPTWIVNTPNELLDIIINKSMGNE